MLDEFVVGLIIIMVVFGFYLSIQNTYFLPKPFIFPYSSDRNIYTKGAKFRQLNSKFKVEINGCKNFTFISGIPSSKAEWYYEKYYMGVERIKLPVLIKCGDEIRVGVAYYEIPKYS